MATGPSYTAVVTREGDYFMIEIPELAGVTQARFEGEIEKMASEYIEVTTERPRGTYHLTVQRQD